MNLLKINKTLFSFLLFFLCTLLPGQNRETIYITLDVSQSMRGVKYNLANYGAQVIALLNQDKEVLYIVGMEDKNISGPDAYKEIQHGFPNIDWRLSEIKDIEAFNKLFKKNQPDQELFIIGDGQWQTHEEHIYTDFLNNYTTGNLKVIFLETLFTLGAASSFEDYLKEHKIGEIYEVRASASEIAEAVFTITEKITGVSAVPDNQLQKTGNCVKFTPELNLKELKLIYQSPTELDRIPNIRSISAGGQGVNFKLLGTPGNESFAPAPGDGLMSAKVFEISENLSAGVPVEICFDGAPNLRNLNIFPVADVKMGSIGVEADLGPEAKINGNVAEICLENDTAIIHVEFEQSGKEIPEKLLKRTEVTVISESETYRAKYKDGKFWAEIPLRGDLTTYSIESELKGYFRTATGLRKIQKGEDCTPPAPKEPQYTHMGDIHFGSISLSRLHREGKIVGRIVDSLTGATLDPSNFNIRVKSNHSFLFKRIKIEKGEGDTVELIIEPRGSWCDCIIPENLKIDFTADPIEGRLIDGKYYNGLKSAMHVKIIKEDSWWERCMGWIISILAALFLIWYFLRLSRKRRFKNGLMAELEYPRQDTLTRRRQDYQKFVQQLRKGGVTAWFNRWFNPFGVESNTLNFNAINLVLKFSATKRRKSVSFPFSSYNKKRMRHPDFRENERISILEIDEGKALTVEHDIHNIRTTNHIRTVSRRAWNDIHAFKVFMGILVFLLSVYILALSVLIIISLFN